MSFSKRKVQRGQSIQVLGLAQPQTHCCTSDFNILGLSFSVSKMRDWVMNLYNRFSLLSLYPPRRSHVMSSAPQSLNPDDPSEKTLPQRPTLSFSSEMGAASCQPAALSICPVMWGLSYSSQKPLSCVAKKQVTLFFSGMEGHCPHPMRHFHVVRNATFSIQTRSFPEKELEWLRSILWWRQS